MLKSVVREGEKLGKNRREGVKGRAMRSDISGVTHRPKKKKSEVIPPKFLVSYIKELGQTCKYSVLRAAAPYGSTRLKPSVST